MSTAHTPNRIVHAYTLIGLLCVLSRLFFPPFRHSTTTQSKPTHPFYAALHVYKRLSCHFSLLSIHSFVRYRIRGTRYAYCSTVLVEFHITERVATIYWDINVVIMYACVYWAPIYKILTASCMLLISLTIHNKFIEIIEFELEFCEKLNLP